MSFFLDCFSLFSSVYNAVASTDYFSVLLGVLAAQSGFALLLLFLRSGKRSLS